MDTKLFRKIVGNIIVDFGFQKSGVCFLKSSEDVICVVGIQKSSYSNDCYINVGYVIRQLNPSLNKPRYVDGDIRTRFGSDNQDIYELDSINNPQDLESNIRKNVLLLLQDGLSINGLKKIIGRDPTLLYQTSLPAQRLLGYAE